jgi:LPXTG-motif cell wall-anchored protein
VHAGRVFVKAGSQRLILATSVDTTVDAEVSASWTPPPPEETTTTTTPPETTTTTAPPQTTTTVGEQTTTTVAIVPDVSVVPGAPTPAPVEATTAEATEGSLPRTGNDVRPLVAAGVALLGAGLVLGVAARRRRA